MTAVTIPIFIHSLDTVFNGCRYDQTILMTIFRLLHFNEHRNSFSQLNFSINATFLFFKNKTKLKLTSRTFSRRIDTD